MLERLEYFVVFKHTFTTLVKLSSCIEMRSSIVLHNLALLLAMDTFYTAFVIVMLVFLVLYCIECYNLKSLPNPPFFFFLITSVRSI